MSDAERAILRDADVILSLDWVDLAGALRGAFGDAITAKVASATLDFAIHGGWNMDYQGLPPVDFPLASDPDDVVAALLEALGAGTSPKALPPRGPRPRREAREAFDLHDVADVLHETIGSRPTMYLAVPLGWSGEDLRLDDPCDYFGSTGGGGIGGGPGVAVGAALALRDAGEGRLPLAVLGDGDFLMGATAIWTAVQERIPMLVVVANNRAYFNDVLHQERVARMRGRPIENRFVGQRIDDPPVDIAAHARSLGAHGIGPVHDPDGLRAAVREGLRIVDAGGVCVIDALVLPKYDAAMASGLMRGATG
jgi:thiamine pyrophosphate-dependent acetolactate synthase large subunit-like protein